MLLHLQDLYFRLTENPFLNAGNSVQYAEGVTLPAPAPQTMAKDVKIMIMNRKILTKDEIYSNQAKTLLGRRKMEKETTMKMVTAGR